MSLFSVTDDTFSIGPGTHNCITIQRDPRTGVLKTNRSIGFPLVQYPSRRHISPLSTTALFITDIAKEAIIAHVGSTLGIQAKNECYENSTYSLLIKTAEAVVSTTGHGYLAARKPAGLGHARTTQVPRQGTRPQRPHHRRLQGHRHRR